MTPDQLVEFAEGLARVAASGGGPTALAAHLASATGAGVLVEDLEWRHIAAAGEGALPATARGLNGGARTVPIAAGAAQLGWLSVVRGEAKQADEPLLRMTASSIAVELSRDAGSRRARRRAFWERLTRGDFHNAGAAREDAQALGITLAPSYVCIALALRQPPDDTDPKALAAETLRVDLDSMLDLGHTLLVFVPADREVDVANARTAATLLQKKQIGGGIAPLCSLLELPRAVGRAQAALSIGRRLYGPGRIAAYDELGAYALLYEGAGTDELRAFARAALEPLRAYDDKHQTEIERTLRVYFNSGENVKTTSAELNVHRHTVFYRLRQIAEITGRSLENPHDQLTLRLAIAIDALFS